MSAAVPGQAQQMAAATAAASEFAGRIPVEFMQRVADAYERARSARREVFQAMLRTLALEEELSSRYAPDRPVGIEGGDWMLALLEHTGVEATRHVLLLAAAALVDAAAGSVGPNVSDDWPETAWPLSFPRD